MTKIKNAEVVIQLLAWPYQPKLVEIILWLIDRYDGIVFTSGFREDDKGVHGCGRGMDIRSRNIERLKGNALHAPPVACAVDPGEVCTHLNSKWIYDPKRPEKLCAVYHNSGKGWHIHLQSHKNTVMK